MMEAIEDYKDKFLQEELAASIAVQLFIFEKTAEALRTLANDLPETEKYLV